MGFFDRFKGPDIHEGLARFRSAERALLLDVREPDDYARGHIPGSMNLPFSVLETAEICIPRPDTPLFVYCLTGARSAQAVSRLRKMGYKQVENIGGILNYRGSKEALS